MSLELIFSYRDVLGEYAEQTLRHPGPEEPDFGFVFGFIDALLEAGCSKILVLLKGGADSERFVREVPDRLRGRFGWDWFIRPGWLAEHPEMAAVVREHGFETHGQLVRHLNLQLKKQAAPHN